MKYISKEHVQNLKDGEFLTGITHDTYKKFLDLPYTEEGVEVKIALAVTTKYKALTTYGNYIEEYEIQDIQNVNTIRYDVLLKSFADAFMERFEVQARQLLTEAFPVALGVLLIDNTLYYVFNLIIDESLIESKVVTGSEYQWVYNKNFTFNEKLDTIIVPKLKFL